MFARSVCQSDVVEFQAISPAAMGSEIVGPRRALEIWRDLVARPCFVGAAVESERPVCGRRTLGYGAGVFVSTAFIENELTNARPGLNARLIASIDAGRPVVLDYNDIARANSTDGLSFVFFDI